MDRFEGSGSPQRWSGVAPKQARGGERRLVEGVLIGMGRFWGGRTVRNRAQRAAGQEWNPRFPGR